MSDITEHATMKATVQYQAQFKNTAAALPQDAFDRLVKYQGQVQQNDMNLAKKIDGMNFAATPGQINASDGLYNALNAQWAEQQKPGGK